MNSIKKIWGIRCNSGCTALLLLGSARSSEGGFKRADGAATVPRAVDAVSFVES